MRAWDVEFGMLKTGHLHGEPDDSSRSFVAHLISGKKTHWRCSSLLCPLPLPFQFHRTLAVGAPTSENEIWRTSIVTSRKRHWATTVTHTLHDKDWTVQQMDVAKAIVKKKHFPRGTNPCATMIGPQQSVGNTQIWHVSCEHGSQIRFWWPHLLKWIPSGMLPKLKSTRVGSSKWALCTLDRLDCPISEDPLGFPRTKVASNCDKISKALRLWPSKSSSHHKTPWRSKVWCFKCTWVCGTIASNHHGHVDSKLRWYLSLFLCKNYGFPWFYCVCEQVHIINFRHIFSCSYWMLLDSYIRSKGPSLGSASESRQHPQPPAVVTAEAAWS